MKLLTIVLPTYKRCKFVEENIIAILPQLIKYKEEVSLLVTDNASNDGTTEVVSRFLNADCDIKYHCQKENIGAHGNFYWGIDNSESEFVFLLGDDDICSPNFLDSVLPILRENRNKLGILHFNYIMGSPDMKGESLFNTNFENANIVVEYNDASEFIKTYWIGPSFISSLIFRKEIMEKGKKTNYHEDCFGYDWLLAIYTGSIGFTCIYYKMPLLVQRFGNSYPNFALNTILGQYKLFYYLDNYIPGISRQWKKQVASQKYYNVVNVISTIINNKDVYSPIYNDLKCCLDNTIHRLALFISIKVPKIISLPLLKLMIIYNKAMRYIQNNGWTC